MSRPDDHVADRVDDLLHGLLSSDDAAQVVQHCLGCADCQALLDAANKRLAALRTVPATEASPGLVQETMKTIDARDRTWKRFRRGVALGVVSMAAVFMFALVGLQVYFSNLSPSPYDLRVLGQTRLQSGTRASLRVRLMDRNKIAALPNVPVEVILHGRQADQLVTLCSFTTDAEGSSEPRFQLPDWEGDCDLIVTAKPGGATETVKQRIHLHRDWKLMLSSDKPVYQPGQEIHLRSLTLGRMDMKPAINSTAVFTVTDPKGNIIFKRSQKTSAFGIASADCLLDAEVLEGPYTVQCTVGDTNSKLAVEVKKYVLPKFKVNVELDQPFYQPGQIVHGKIKADYFFGKPVGGGTVEIAVATVDVGGKPFSELKRTTTGDGATEFEFALPATLVGRPQDHGDARMMLTVSVTDSAGQKESRSVSRIVTNLPLHIEVIPENGSLVEGVANTVFVLTTYPDGRPARTQISIPDLDAKLQTSALGAAHVEWASSSPRVFIVKAVDEQGLSASQAVNLSDPSPNGNFLLRTDKAVYVSGDTMNLLAFGSGVEPIFFDLIKDGQTVLTETIRLANGQGTYQLDLPPELSGTIQLCAYRFGGEGLAVRKTRVLFIKPGQQLNVRVTADKSQYRPRTQAQLQLQLTDQHGQPIPGALSVSAVDEAVFSVLDQRPGLEKTFYALEQELLKPVYAIYPWVPDLESSSSPQERRELEQALFATTVQTVSQHTANSPTSKIKPITTAQQSASPHSLTISTFSLKASDAERSREVGLKWVSAGWWAFLWVGAGGGIIGVVIVIRYALVELSRKSRASWLIVSLFLVAGAVVLGIVSLLTIGETTTETFAKVGSAVRGLESEPTSSMIWREAMNAQSVDLTNPEIGLNPEAALTNTPVRVRDWFPETLLWKPQLITDDQGRITLPVDLADSITTWRLTVSAVTADGRLGAKTESVKVFQPFFVEMNLPVALTRNDEVSLPVVVYNYLDKPQTVELSLDNAPWFAQLDDAVRKVDLSPGEVKSLSYRIKVQRVGKHTLQVTARAAGVSDAVKRDIEVVSDGHRVEQVANGTLAQPADLAVNVPANAIEGSPKAILKLYPSNFSQVVEGLDGIFRMPSGCFEQTSSTTYPNVLALDYLRRTGKSVPEVEAKARQYVHLGYQRLLGFEVIGGGFDWFGRPPANRTLTAYGLMEFQDMAKVHDVDPNLIERTRRWLLNKREADGTWAPEGHALHDDPTRRGKDDARLTTTAYIAWAVFEGQPVGGDASKTLAYLLTAKPSTISDPYTLALLANAMLALGAENGAKDCLRRLESLKQESPDGKLVWWEQAASERTMFYGAGDSGRVEATALAALAMLKAKSSPGTSGRALGYLVQKKDANGTWHSTQATVLALKAVLAGTEAGRDGDPERRVLISWMGGQREVVIPPDQAEVMQLIDLSDGLTVGQQPLTIREKNNAPVGYQLLVRYHVPNAAPPEGESLTITIDYDRTELGVGETVVATATVVNTMKQTAPMVMLDLPIPGGFTITAEDLAKEKKIARFQINPRSAVVYLLGLEPGESMKLTYRLRATMPVKVTVPSGLVYEYYDPDKKGTSKPASLTVAGRR